MNTPIPDDVLKQIQAKLSDNGQTLKIRYIDKDPSKGLLGVRITNAKKLMEEVWSMQILDRSTVSLAIGGFDNDHHVSLTGEDGETFLESIAAEIPRELWDLIPTAAASQQQAGPSVAEVAKLTQFLKDKYPAQFGAYGTATVAPDFYQAIINLLSTVDADYRSRRDYDSIVEMEAAARKGDIQANRHLAAVSQAADENMRQELRIAALYLMYAANDARAAAINARARMSSLGLAVPPAAAFPETPDMTPDNLRDQIIDVSLTIERPTFDAQTNRERRLLNWEGKRILSLELPGEKVNGLGDGRPLLTGPADVNRGDMVVVANGNTPQYRQMGTVIETHAEHAQIRFHANGPLVPINYSDLVRM